MIWNSVKYLTYLDRKELSGDLKMVYSAVNEKQALKALGEFKQKWDSKYPTICKSRHKHWENLCTIFEYPDDIRKVIYTTNAIESLNSVIRKAIKNRRIFPTASSAMKTVFLAIESASKKWTVTIRNWKPALNRFVIEFEDSIKNV